CRRWVRRKAAELQNVATTVTHGLSASGPCSGPVLGEFGEEPLLVLLQASRPGVGVQLPTAQPAHGGPVGPCGIAHEVDPLLGGRSPGWSAVPGSDGFTRARGHRPARAAALHRCPYPVGPERADESRHLVPDPVLEADDLQRLLAADRSHVV